MIRRAPLVWVLTGLAILGAAAVLLSCALGAVSIPVWKQLSIWRETLFEGGAPLDDRAAHLYWNIRLPRVLTAYAAGMGLAAVGALFQALLRNPLAEPYIIGVSPGAALGATVFIAASALASGNSAETGALTGRAVSAFAGALAAVAAAYLLASRGRFLNLSDILLAGIAVGSLAAALTSYLWIRVLQQFRGLLYWMMGNLGSASWRSAALLACLTIPTAAACWRLAPALNLMMLGEERAASLGLNVERFKRWMLLLGSLTAAGTVAAAGMIGFVGIIAPHIVRRLVGSDNGRAVPASCLFGGAFLTLCDLVARTAAAPLELPVGILTAAIGAPFFLMILRQSQAGRS